MKASRRATSFQVRGFTIIELLTAMAVLSILVVLVAQIISVSTKATTISGNQLNNLEKSRRVFDRIGMDLSSAISNAEIPFLVDKSPESDTLRFYSQKSGFDSSSRGISLVEYRVNTAGTSSPYAWERGLVGVDSLPFGGASAPSLSPTYQSIAEGIIRFKVSFLEVGTGAMSPSPPASPLKTAAVIVTMVVVDDNILKTVTQGEIDTLAGKFTGTISGTMTAENNYFTSWNETIKTLSASNVSPRLIQATRVYQTYYEVR